MPNVPFACPALTTFGHLDDLELEVVGQRPEPGRAILACRVLAADRWCRRCGCEGTPHGSVVRVLAHGPLGWRPTTLHIRDRIYRCSDYGHVWRQNTTAVAPARARISRGGVRWALVASVAQHLSIARVADGLGVSWHTANEAVLVEGNRILLPNSACFDGVHVLGVDEHVCRDTRRGGSTSR